MIVTTMTTIYLLLVLKGVHGTTSLQAGHFAQADLQAFEQRRLWSLYRWEEAVWWRCDKMEMLNVSERCAPSFGI